LDAIGVLDGVAPGFLFHSLQASPRWRQALFLAIAIGVVENPVGVLLSVNGEASEGRPWKDVQRHLADALRSLSAKEIVRAILGETPDGLGGCLAKLGDQPMRDSGNYLSLVGLMTSTEPEMKLRAKTLLQLDRLDSDRLSAVLELDPIALFPDLLRRVRCGLAARRVNGLIRAIRLVSTASEDALRQSIADRSISFRGHEFAEAWLSRADRPPVICEAIDLHSDFERVTPATAEAVGREFANCLRTKMGDLASGVWGAWVWRPGPLIATVTLCVEGPLLTGIYGHGNRMVPAEHARLLKSILTDLGVRSFTRCDVPDELRVLAVGRFRDARVNEFEFD
tara:strand:+ start:582 stop:1598 length:1017 start_codon:yes stop_codon:yes gene_type:complete